jgi:signal transduction histidine kinase/CheY-like chemotaxis protein
MNNTNSSPAVSSAGAGSPLSFLESGGVCGALARSINWSSSSLGPAEDWPTSLKTAVALLLRSRHPMLLMWGEQLIQFYNDAFLPSFGRGKHPAAMGQRASDCWQEVWPIIWPQIEDVMVRAKPSWNFDQLVPIFRNGKIEDVFWTYGYSPVMDERGAVGGAFVVCTENTASVLAARRLRSILGLSEKTDLSTDPAHLLAAAAEVFGRSPDDIRFAMIYRHAQGGIAVPAGAAGLDSQARGALEQRIHPNLPPPSAERQVRAIGGLLPTSADDDANPVFLAHFAGGFITFGLSARLPFDDLYRNYLLHLTDIVSRGMARLGAQAERDHLLREVETEQERLQTLFAQAPAFMCALEGPTHIFRLANERYYQLVGRRDIIGKPVAEAIPEAAGQGFFELLDEVYRTGESFFGNDVPIHLARNAAQPPELRFMDFVYQAARASDGAITGIVVHGIDQTERWVSAQAMREADRRKDEFLALLAHELRNPLAPINSYALMLERVATDPNAVRQAASVMNRQVAQMVRLIDDLLDVSRISSGKIELRTVHLELAPSIQQAVEAARPFYEERGVKLKITLPGEPVYLNGDAARVAQVVGNLLHNGAKFTARGGLVELRVEVERQQAVIRVCDTGVGIAKEDLERIFTMFAQADTSLERTNGGLGIGLALVRSFVELHGGTVTAASEGPGVGSEFTIRLPLAPAKDQGTGARLSIGERAVQRRILIIDDNRDGCDSMALLLKTSGHDVRTAYDGATGIAEAERSAPEFIVMDIGMPHLNGYDACRTIRAADWGKNIVMIALTGWGQESDRRKSDEAGFDHHVVKPFDLAVFERLLGR